MSIVYSCGNGAGARTPSDSISGNKISGADVYSNNCMVCHGQDGTAGMSGATDLSKSTLTHEQAVNVITNGRNGMRPFHELTAAEIDAVVSHIETLRK